MVEHSVVEMGYQYHHCHIRCVPDKYLAAFKTGCRDLLNDDDDDDDEEVNRAAENLIVQSDPIDNERARALC